MNGGDDGDSIPLLDEVHNLLEKEKLLLELKLSKGQVNAEQWKSRYDNLVAKVSNGEFRTANYLEKEEQPDQIEITFSHRSADEQLQKVFAQIRSAGPDNIILDVFDTPLSQNHCKAIIKALKENKCSAKQLFLSNCGLDSECSVIVPALCKYSHLESIDFSHNTLSYPFEEHIIDMLKVRKKTPQYILLHDNMKRSSPTLFLPSGLHDTGSSVGIKDFIFSLSQHTWGLSFSLLDYYTVPMVHSAKATGKSKGSTKTTGKGKNNPIYHTRPEPYLCVELLRCLNASISMAQEEEANYLLKNAETALLEQPPNPNDPPVKPGKKKSLVRMDAMAVGRGMRELISFTLCHSRLGKQSMGLLSKTLDLSVNSLTDLDISYTMGGFHTAECVRRFLVGPSAPSVHAAGSPLVFSPNRPCQLMRLSMAGCGIGDASVSKLWPTLLCCKTLTYVDLSSNQITDVGVTAIVNSFRDVQTTALSMLDISFVPCSVPPCEIVLSTVILIGNHDISQNSFDSLQREVRNAGLLMSFRYSSPVDLQAPTPPSANSITSEPEVSYGDSALRANVFGAKRISMLYTVRMNHFEKAGRYKVQFQWRPSFVGDMEDSLSHTHCPVRIGVGHAQCYSWTIRVENRRKDEESDDYVVLAQDSVGLCSFTAVDGWLVCDCEISLSHANISLFSHLTVSVHASDNAKYCVSMVQYEDLVRGDATIPQDRSISDRLQTAIHCVESMHFVISRVTSATPVARDDSNERFIRLGGDADRSYGIMTGSVCELSSLISWNIPGFASLESLPVPVHHTIQRVFTWHDLTPIVNDGFLVRLRWDMKLSMIGPGFRENSQPNTYCWCISILRYADGYSEAPCLFSIAEGTGPVPQMTSSSADDAENDMIAPGPSAFAWQEQCAEWDSGILFPNDMIVLSSSVCSFLLPPGDENRPMSIGSHRLGSISTHRLDEFPNIRMLTQGCNIYRKTTQAQMIDSELSQSSIGDYMCQAVHNNTTLSLDGL